MDSKYYGHDSQIFGVEEHRLIGGKGDGMRLYQVKNGKGLEFTISCDRCADISRLSYKGDNYGYFSVNGYVAPSYYDQRGIGFLKSFTAGFLTTCGLTAVGSPCIDEGVELPLHGTISNIPAENIYYNIEENEIQIHAKVNDSTIFGDKLVMNRNIQCSLNSNRILITDRIKNLGDNRTPLMFLYHFNIGYPLLSEEATLYIPSIKVTPRNEHAKSGISQWDEIIAPKAGFEEQCYYHNFDEFGLAAIYNSTITKGLAFYFDPSLLDYFVEWKMMGEKDYVLGLEPGNCHPDGRDVMRRDGTLKYIESKEEMTYQIEVLIIENERQWNELISSYKK